MTRRTATRACLLVVFVSTTFLCAGLVQLPVYTIDDLQNDTFVRAEIARLEKDGETLNAAIASATGMNRLVLNSEKIKLERTMEGLRYVQSNGFKPLDPAFRPYEFLYQSKTHTLPARPPDPPAPDLTIYEPTTKGVIPPVAMKTPDISLPSNLVEDGVHGVVKVKIIVDENGKPQNVEILEGIRTPIDTHVAGVIVSTWTYQPATFKGKAVKSVVRVAVSFDIKPGQTPAPPAKTQTASDEGKPRE